MSLIVDMCNSMNKSLSDYMLRQHDLDYRYDDYPSLREEFGGRSDDEISDIILQLAKNPDNWSEFWDDDRSVDEINYADFGPINHEGKELTVQEAAAMNPKYVATTEFVATYNNSSLFGDTFRAEIFTDSSNNLLFYQIIQD